MAEWKKKLRFTCTHQGYHGTLLADINGCAFESDLLKTDFSWNSVKWIRVTTKHIKDTPTSVLALKTLQPKQSFLARSKTSNKYYFYHFEDIVHVTKKLQELQQRVKGFTSVSQSSGSGNNIFISDGSNKSSRNSCDNRVTGGDINNNSHTNDCTSVATAFEPVKGAGHPSLAFPSDDGYLNSQPPSRTKRANNFRDNGEDEDEARCAGGGTGGVSMPFIIGVPRHTEMKGTPALISPQQQHHGSSAESRKGRNQRQYLPKTFLHSCCPDWFFNLVSDKRKRESIVFLVLPMVIFFLVVLLFSIESVEHWWQPSPQDKLTHVIHGLSKLHQWREGHHGMLKEDWLHGEKDDFVKKVPPPVSLPQVTLGDVTVVVKEILLRFVEAQQEMVSLRLRHFRRKHGGFSSSTNMQHIPPGGLFMSTRANGEMPGMDLHGADRAPNLDGKLSPRRFSLACIGADLSCLAGYLYEAVATVHRVLWSIIGGSDGGDSSSNNNKAHPSSSIHWLASSWRTLVRYRGGKSDMGDFSGSQQEQQLLRYSEVLANGQIVMQNVTFEENEDRQSCLRLSREIVHAAELLEEILLMYQDVMMSPQYEAYLHEMYSNPVVTQWMKSSWLSSVVTDDMSMNAWGEGKEMLGEQGEHLLRAILLRRHALLLLELDPLQEWSQFHRSKVMQEKQGKHHQQTRSKKTATANPSRDVVEEILRDFVMSTGQSNWGSSPESAIQRNILQELRYWHEHEEDWQTFIYWRLNASVSEGRADSANNSNLQNDVYIDEAISAFPLFRGLWCFWERPLHLFTKKDIINSTTTMKMPDDETAATSSVSPLSETKVKGSAGANDVLEGKSVHSAVMKGGSTVIDCHGGSKKADRPTGGLVEYRFKFLPLGKALSEKTEQKEKDGDCDESDIDGQQGSDDETSPSVATFEGLRSEMNSPNDGKSESGENNIIIRLKKMEYLSREVKRRWVEAFDLFLVSQGQKHSAWSDNTMTGTSSGFRDDVGSHPRNSNHNIDVDDGYMTEVMHIRQRFLQVLVRLDRHYGRYLQTAVAFSLWPFGGALDFMKHRFSSKDHSWWVLLWPPSWFASEKSSLSIRRWMWRMKVADPAVSRLLRDTLQAPMGEVEDFSWLLLRLMTMPPDILELQSHLHNLFFFMLCLLLLVALVTAVSPVLLK